ncbi:MAG: FKBP-type peptidyl-prolyl cis-trans isomerase [Marinobacterium sp.]|nr:FKBP-type peptidyl-prolyl cis-trans isomerase [Marinobacterium sp.]
MGQWVLIALVVIAAAIFFWRSQQNSQLAAENAAAGKAFLEANAQEEGVVALESGLQYKILQAGSGDQHPAETDKVKVHYHGTLIDGRVFDSSVERDKPISFGLNQVIKGWTEGVQLMVVGEKRRLFIPAELAYGQGSAGIITPGSTLIFDVELLGINE